MYASRQQVQHHSFLRNVQAASEDARIEILTSSLSTDTNAPLYPSTALQRPAILRAAPTCCLGVEYAALRWCPKARFRLSVEFIFQIFNPGLDYFQFTFSYINQAMKLNNLKLISSTSLSICIDNESGMYDSYCRTSDFRKNKRRKLMKANSVKQKVKQIGKLKRAGDEIRTHDSVLGKHILYR
jgi:hypothetical protein